MSYGQSPTNDYNIHTSHTYTNTQAHTPSHAVGASYDLTMLFRSSAMSGLDFARSGYSTYMSAVSKQYPSAGTGTILYSQQTGEGSGDGGDVTIISGSTSGLPNVVVDIQRVSPLVALTNVVASLLQM